MPRLESVQKYKGSTWEIVLDNNEHVYLSFEIVSRFSLSEGQEYDDEDWQEIVAENEFRKARERALYLLDYRDYSYIELYNKLEKTYGTEICEPRALQRPILKAELTATIRQCRLCVRRA